MSAKKLRAEMSPQTLRRKIRNLSARPRITTALERILRPNLPGSGSYKSQKEHWLAWLREYDGPGQGAPPESASRLCRRYWKRWTSH